MSAKRKAGRPKGSGKGLTDLVQVRLSPELKALTEAAAQREGVDVAEWWRRAAHAQLGGR